MSREWLASKIFVELLGPSGGPVEIERKILCRTVRQGELVDQVNIESDGSHSGQDAIRSSGCLDVHPF